MHDIDGTVGKNRMYAYCVIGRSAWMLITVFLRAVVAVRDRAQNTDGVG